VFTTLKSVVISCFLLLFCQFSWAQLNIHFLETQDKNVHPGVIKMVKLSLENNTDSNAYVILKPNTANFLVYHSKYMVPAKQNLLVYAHYNPGLNPVNTTLELRSQLCDSFGNFIGSEGIYTLNLTPSNEKRNLSTQIIFNNIIHDFGAIKEGPIGECTFQFINNDSSAIHVTAFRSSCGCLAGSYTQGDIETGALGEIKLKYYTQNRLGIFNKTAMITFSNGEIFNLTVMGIVVTTEMLQEFK
jgi:hypothetical protein